MEKPSKKLKKLIMITGTTGAVYAGFKYLLPLVAPFFAGYVLALLLRPSARFFSYRLKMKLWGRVRRVPVGAAGGVEFALILGGLGALLYRVFPALFAQVKLLMIRFPVWYEAFGRWLTGSCGRFETAFGLRRGCMSELASEMLLNLSDSVKERAMPFLMSNSLWAVKAATEVSLFVLVAFLAAVLSLQEMEDLRDRRDQSLFRREFNLIGNRLVQTGKAWFKSQGIILLITTGLCMSGMFLLGNPYFVIAGVGIGIMDALPILGTGTVLVPWAVFAALQGDWRTALILAGLYLVCYLVRQLLEARLMGGQMGLSPLETLAAVYVGLELFGFFGFILGPLGLLLIEDLVEAWAGE